MQERRVGGYINRGGQNYRPGPPQPLSVPQPLPAQPRVLKPAKKIQWGVVILVSLVTAVTLAAVVVYITRDKSPLPASIARQVNFPLYLPDASRGVRVDQSSYSFHEGALTYTVHTPDNSQVFLSEQTVPKSFDLTTFLQHIKNKQTLSNRYGQGQAGVSENNLVISEIIGDSWVFISGPINIEPSQLTLVFQSLQKD